MASTCAGPQLLRLRTGGEAADAARKGDSPRHPAVPVASPPLSWQRVTAGKGQGMEGMCPSSAISAAQPVQVHSTNPAASGAAKASREHSQTPNPSPEPSRVRNRFPARCELLGARVGFVPTSHGQTRAPLAGASPVPSPGGVAERRALTWKGILFIDKTTPQKKTHEKWKKKKWECAQSY